MNGTQSAFVNADDAAPDSQFDRDYAWDVLKNPDAIRDGLAVFHYGSGGAYLFYSMLDRHPEVIGFPILNPSQHVAKIIFWRLLEASSEHQETTIEYLSGILWECFCSTEFPSENRERHFRALVAIGIEQRLKSDKPLTLSFMFKLFVAAIVNEFGCTVGSHSPVLIWNEHNPGRDELFNLGLLRAIAPDMKFVTVVRYPEKSVDAHFDRYHRYYLESVVHRITMQHFDQRVLTRIFIDSFVDNNVIYGPNAWVVRFEDIHNSTRLVMQGVANQLGLSWHDVLLESTSWGAPWIYENRYTGTRDVTEGELVTNHLDWFDRARLRYFLAAEYRRWGYGRTEWTRCIPAALWRLLSRIVPFRTQRILFRSFIQKLKEDDPKLRRKLIRNELRVLWRSHRRLNARLFAGHRSRQRNPDSVAAVLYAAEPGYQLHKISVVGPSDATVQEGTASLSLPRSEALANERIVLAEMEGDDSITRRIPVGPSVAKHLEVLFDQLLSSCLDHLKGREVKLRVGMKPTECPPIAICGTGSGARSLAATLEARLGIKLVARLAEYTTLPSGERQPSHYDAVTTTDKATWIVLIATDHWDEGTPDWDDVASELSRAGFQNLYNATALMLGTMYSKHGTAARPSEPVFKIKS